MSKVQDIDSPQGRPLLDWAEHSATDPDPRLLWQESFDADAAIVADIIRQMSHREELVDRGGLFQAFQDYMQAMAEHEARLRVLAKAREQAENLVNTTDESASADEALEALEQPVSPPVLSRRDVLGSLLRLRHQKLAGDDESQPYPGDEHTQTAEAEDLDIDLSGIEVSPDDIKVREISPEYFDALLPVMLAAHDDVAVLQGMDGGEYYHCRLLLSATYGRLLTGRNNPPELFADTIRANSRDYPRPIALDMFEYPPFDFSPELIQEVLNVMPEHPQYEDIAFVESSVGTVYMYSKKYLDRDYAVFLANNIDTGLIDSP